MAVVGLNKKLSGTSVQPVATSQASEKDAVCSDLCHLTINTHVYTHTHITRLCYFRKYVHSFEIAVWITSVPDVKEHCEWQRTIWKKTPKFFCIPFLFLFCCSFFVLSSSSGLGVVVHAFPPSTQ